jgi:hypothetical protein
MPASLTVPLHYPIAQADLLKPSAASRLARHALIFVCWLTVIALGNVSMGDPLGSYLRESSAAAVAGGEEVAEAGGALQTSTLTPLMQGALVSASRSYRVSRIALQPVFEAAQRIGKERNIDPLLIVAIIGVESGFNPHAESPMGALGLMQVIPRFHMDKLPEGVSGQQAFLDPVINVRAGVLVLEEAVRRRGSLIGGLQHYAGSSDSEGAYANKVLAEKQRLEIAATRWARAN